MLIGRHTATAWFTGLTLWLSHGAAHAQPPPPAAPSPQTQSDSAPDAAYDEFIREALEEYQLGHWEEARSLLTSAHEISPSARTLRGLGMVAFELRDYAEAARLLETALNDERKSLTADQHAAVAELLERTHRYLGRYELQVTPGDARLELDVDGMPVDMGPDGALVLEAGAHTLTVRSPGYEAFTRPLDIQGGERETLTIALQSSNPHSDSSPQGPTQVSVQPSLRPYRAWGIGLGAAGGAVAVAGGALGLAALLSAKKVNDDDGGGRTHAHRMAIGADAALGLGAGLALTGLALWLVRESPPESHDESSFVPQLTRQCAGFTYARRF